MVGLSILVLQIRLSGSEDGKRELRDRESTIERKLGKRRSNHDAARSNDKEDRVRGRGEGSCSINGELRPSATFFPSL